MIPIFRKAKTIGKNSVYHTFLLTGIMFYFIKYTLDEYLWLQKKRRKWRGKGYTQGYLVYIYCADVMLLSLQGTHLFYMICSLVVWFSSLYSIYSHNLNWLLRADVLASECYFSYT